MAISDYERKTKEMNDKISTCEFDVDTGTYIEDVRGNDFIGVDKDGDGLIDDVEKLIEESCRRSDEYNAEQDRIRQEELNNTPSVTENTKEEKDEKEDALDMGI